MAVAGPFSRCGAKNWKNMSPKTHPVKFCLEKDGQPPDFDHNCMSNPYKKFLIHWLPIFLYCLFIFIQSSYPSAITAPGLPHIDKLAHFIGYGFLGLLFFRAFRTLWFMDHIDFAIIMSMVSSTLYGISDEIHQHYVPFRNADMMDILADAFGSFCSVFFYQLLMIRYRDRIPELTKLPNSYRDFNIMVARHRNPSQRDA